MNAPFHPASPTHRAYPGPTPPRGLGRVVERLDVRRRPVLAAIVGWLLVIAALVLTTWARFQPSNEPDAGRIALAAIVLAMMAAGVALSGGTRCKP